jgi:nitrite reductase/ring-hydroxylating ferredoxin subunit
MLLAACGEVTSPSPPQSVDETVTLASYPALATVGGIARLNGTSTPIAVVRATADSYRAFSLICPHRSGPVGVVGSGFRCPNHGATFSSSGAWTGGQSTRGLFEFTVVSDGTTLAITS